MFLKIVKCEKRVGKRALRPRESTYSRLSNEPKKNDIGALLGILCEILTKVSKNKDTFFIKCSKRQHFVIQIAPAMRKMESL